MRFWLALAVAVIAAALADPLLEFASNSGFFGSGHFTDRSNIDVVPTVLLGLLFGATVVAWKARAMLHGVRPSNRALDETLATTLPLAFAIQLGVLYTMETIEQVVVYGHSLGGTIWLGGPTGPSFAVHGIFCCIVAFAVSRGVRSLARTAVRVIRHVRAFDSRPIQPPRPITIRDLDVAFATLFGPVAGRIGERAPPAL